MTRPLHAANLLAMVSFVALTTLAMRVYPGGSWYDRAHTGHHLWHNFLCDLLRHETMSGRPNPGARLALGGMLSLVVGLTLHWFVVAGRLRALKVRRLVLGAGATSSLSTIAVALTPTDRFDALHTAALSLALASGALAATASILTLARQPDTPRWLARLALLAWLLLLGSSAVFVHHTFLDGRHLRLLPALQRVTTIVGLLYIVACATFTAAERTPRPAAALRCGPDAPRPDA